VDRIGPGALLAGRYRLIERLEGDPVASLWQAEDVTLERSAAIRILAAGHSHVDATLDAARRSAVIDDPRLQRVLGVGVEAGSGYVILEWVDGPTAVQLAGRVSEEEACRISFEVADALAAARAKGLRHARLTPGHVRRAGDGRVRVTGLAIDAAMIGRGIEPTRDDTDVADTVALLYALISGRWPFGFVEGMLGAPYQSGKPVSLRELTKVSAEVEELCIRTFAGQPPATPAILAATLRGRLVSRTPAAEPGPASGAGGAAGAVVASAAGSLFSRPVQPGPAGTPPHADVTQPLDVPAKPVSLPSGQTSVVAIEPAADQLPDTQSGDDQVTTAFSPAELPAGSQGESPAESPVESSAGSSADVPHPSGDDSADTTAEQPAVIDTAHSAATVGLAAQDSSAAVSQTVPAPASPSHERRSSGPVGDTDEHVIDLTGHAGRNDPPNGRPDAGYRDPAERTIELPDLRRASVSASGGTPPAAPPPDDGSRPSPLGAMPTAETVLPQAQRRGRVVQLPEAIQGHTRVPQWRRATDPPLASSVAGKARKSGMQWSADPDDGWSLLPGEARGPEDPDWRGGRSGPGGSGYNPYYDDGDDGLGPQDEESHRRRRGVVGGIVILAVVIFVVVGGIWAFNRADLVGGPRAEGAPTVGVTVDAPVDSAAPASPEVPAPPPTAVTPVGVQSLDPPPGDNSERDAEAPLAIDGDPATAWTTETYNAQKFGGLKDGVGLLVSLGQPSTVSSMTISAPGAGGTFEIRAASQPLFDGSTVLVGSETSDAGPITLSWDPVETPYLIVWFTALPGGGSEWRGTIAEIQLA